MGVPPNPKLDHFGIETHGFGDPPFQETPKYRHELVDLRGVPILETAGISTQ